MAFTTDADFRLTFFTVIKYYSILVVKELGKENFFI